MIKYADNVKYIRVHSSYVEYNNNESATRYACTSSYFITGITTLV